MGAIYPRHARAGCSTGKHKLVDLNRLIIHSGLQHPLVIAFVVPFGLSLFSANLCISYQAKTMRMRHPLQNRERTPAKNEV